MRESGMVFFCSLFRNLFKSSNLSQLPKQGQSSKAKVYPLFLRGVSCALLISFFVSDIAWAAPGLQLSLGLQSNPSSLRLSPEFSRVSEIHKGSEKTLLIQVQDAHTNLSAQKNIAKILDELIRRYGVKTVFVEGGTKDESLTSLRPLADTRTRERVAEKYLMQAKLNGAEWNRAEISHPVFCAYFY